MQRLDGRLIVSAHDLVGFLGCEHVTVLDLEVAEEKREKPEYTEDPQLKLLQKRGFEHEARCLERLEAEGRTVREIQKAGFTLDTLERAERETLAAMREGVAVVYQGTLLGDGRWRGHPDFLVRVERPSALGPWSYEPADAKLAQRVKAAALLQLCTYADRLETLQGVAPEHAHVVTGDGEMHPHRLADYGAYYRMVKRRFEERVFGDEDPPATYPDPVDHCSICRWWSECTDRRRDDDHLCRVAGMSRLQTKRLVSASVPTLTALASLPAGERKPEIAPRTLTKLREQARLQQEQYGDGVVRYELIRPDPEDPGQGLAALPEPSTGDLFLDFESDPWALEGGLEFLIGTVVEENGAPAYSTLWAHDRDAEKRAFESLIDTIVARLEKHPGMHVYHYGAYEAAAIKRLMGRYATREEEVDRLLRGRVLVDLFSVVRQGVRVSQESYSLKKVEKIYMPEREGPKTRPGFALVEYEKWLEHPDQQSILDGLAAYNKDDCVSTWMMRTWLEGLRKEAEAAFGVELGRPKAEDGAPTEEGAAQLEETRRRVEALTKAVPADVAERTKEQHARWILAQLLDWHRREAKPQWWLHFTLMKAPIEELVASSDAIGELRFDRQVGTVDQSILYRYRHDPEQEHKFHEGDGPYDPATGNSAGTVWAVDPAAGTIDLKRGKRNDAPHPTALIPGPPMRTPGLRDALRHVADAVIDTGIDGAGPYRAARDLLLGEPPRLRGTTDRAPLAQPGEKPLDAGCRLALALHQGCLAVQGPPGSGKTYVGARMIVELVKKGKRVGICATAHKAITNLVDEVCAAAAEAKVRVPIVQKGDDGDGSTRAEVELTKKNEEVESGLAEGRFQVAAGTQWLFARDRCRAASTSSSSTRRARCPSPTSSPSAAPRSRSFSSATRTSSRRSPRAPTRTAPASRPSSTSSPAHQTIPPDRGLFLETTWRLHPDVCAFTSEVFYEGRLEPEAQNARQRVGGTPPPGRLRPPARPRDPPGNAARSSEEARQVARAVEACSGSRGPNAKGETRRIKLSDILVVAPYNAQVGEISRLLRDQFGEGERVGTVDKFQGQEGAVVLYSMATSSPEDAPRGMDFLYSGNRFNVAVSRARGLAVLVCSPDLLKVRCRTPEEMRLANALCRFVELSGPVDWAALAEGSPEDERELTHA